MKYKILNKLAAAVFYLLIFSLFFLMDPLEPIPPPRGGPLFNTPSTAFGSYGNGQGYGYGLHTTTSLPYNYGGSTADHYYGGGYSRHNLASAMTGHHYNNPRPFGAGNSFLDRFEATSRPVNKNH